MKRLLCTILVSLLASMLLFAAGDQEKTNSDVASVEMWHYWPADSDARKAPLMAAIETWNRAHPEYTIVPDGVQGDPYKTKIRTAIAANEAPELFVSFAGGFSEPFVSAGEVLKLEDYLDQDVRSSVVTWENQTYSGDIYAIPLDMYVSPFYLNESIFNEYGLKLPETFDDLLEAVKVLKSNDIIPMSVGAKSVWPIEFYWDIIVLRTVGAERYLAAARGEVPFNDPDFIRASDYFVQLVEAGAFGERTMALSLEKGESRANLLSGRSAMYFNTSSAMGQIEGSTVEGKMVMRKFPVIEGEAGNKNDFIGGAINSIFINADVSDPQKTVNAAVEIARTFSELGYVQGANFPVWRLDIEDDSAINSHTLEMVELTQDAENVVLVYGDIWGGSKQSTLRDLIAQLFAGKLDARTFAEAMYENQQRN